MEARQGTCCEEKAIRDRIAEKAEHSAARKASSAMATNTTVANNDNTPSLVPNLSAQLRTQKYDFGRWQEDGDRQVYAQFTHDFGKPHTPYLGRDSSGTPLERDFTPVGRLSHQTGENIIETYRQVNDFIKDYAENNPTQAQAAKTVAKLGAAGFHISSLTGRAAANSILELTCRAEGLFYEVGKIDTCVSQRKEFIHKTILIPYDLTKDKVEAGEWTPEQGITAVTLYAPIAIAGSVMFAKKLHIPSIESLRPANNMNIEASSFAKVYQGYGKLTVRQERLLEALPKGGKDPLFLEKGSASMNDLAFLTAKTGDEFTMFTLGSKRMILRGNKEGVNIEESLALKIHNEKWTWSGHTHPGSTDLVLNASGADRGVLKDLEQTRSMIANSSGTRNVFDRKNDHHLTSEAAKKAYKDNG